MGKTSVDFWSSLKLTWQQCDDIPTPSYIVSITELNKNVYVSTIRAEGGHPFPYKYNSAEDKWSRLPNLPCIQFTLVSIPALQQLLAIGGIESDGNDGIVSSNKVFLWDEKYNKWLTPYPEMPTARYHCAAIYYKSKIIVAGGIADASPISIMTRSVEVLHIDKNCLSHSYWTEVERLPHIINQPGPLLVDDKLYITVGFDKFVCSQTSIVVASLPLLLQNNTDVNAGQVWEKLPDLPYPSPSINLFHKRLVTFGGIRLVEQAPEEGKPVVWKLVPLVHLYNPDTRSWDCVGDIPHGYCLGRSAHIGEDKIFFAGGTIGKFITDTNDDLVTTCSLLTITSQ